MLTKQTLVRLDQVTKTRIIKHSTKTYSGVAAILETVVEESEEIDLEAQSLDGRVR
jgi:hypothetical protein